MDFQISKLKRRSLLAATFVTAAFLLQGCGSDGSEGPAGPAGATGAAGAPGKDATAVVSAAAISADSWAALAPKGEVTSVTIASPPVVEFKVTDGNGNPVVGLGNTSKSATATVASYPNLMFSLAKLVPGKDGGPSKWVSYIVTSVPTTTTALTAQKPSTDTTGTLVDNGDGSYKYTFYRDITKVKDVVAGLTLTGANKAGDLGDLTYDPNLTHRLVIGVYGNARGTGSNTANAVTVTPAVAMANPLNIIYDFIPATGKAVAATDLQRELVSKDNCNECHNQIGVTTPHGGRVDTRFCVVCHTDQRKYGNVSVASTNGAFPALTEKATVNATTGLTSYSYSPSTTVSDGDVNPDFPVFIHRIHNGSALVKTNYNYGNVAFNNKGYSMLDNGQRMCTKCHDSTKAAQADNWNSVPTKLACGACHDGIKWSDGTGTTLAGATTGHVGRAQSSDKTCALCHAPADIKTYHQTLNVTKHNPTVASGLKNFTYEIQSAAVNSANDVSIVFKISADGTAQTFKAAAAGMADPLTGFTGGPSFLLAYAVTQDGITAPVDYNNVGVAQAQAISVSLASLLDTAKTADGSLSAPNGGYYTATIKGTGANKFPVGAKLRAVGLNGYFTQVSPAAARHAISVVKAVTGDTARRTVVDPAKCSNCHEWFEGHGGNRVYETQICVMCHVPGLATSGRSATDAFISARVYSAADKKILADWKFSTTAVNAALKLPVTSNNFKDMIHGVHAGMDRVTPFMDARLRGTTLTLLDFRRMAFPGKLKNCETCHVSGTAAATTFNTVPANTLASTYETIDAAYDAAITAGTATVALAKTALGLKTANATDHVTTPFAAACVSCHDSTAAKAHFTLNGGQLQVSRSLLVLTGEACNVCHGAGAQLDTAKVHK